ncbi:MAG: chemotaxis protein CheA [Nitrospinae bacterium]|nr:chemotaxis protein CheA [Nitrospinota bacterium]
MDYSSESEIFDNFLAESAEILGELEQGVITLERTPSDREPVDNIFRCVHSLKGNSSLFGISGIKMLSHSLENLMSRIRDRQIDVDGAIIGLVLRGVDHLKEMFSALMAERKETPITQGQEEFLTEIEAVLQSNGTSNHEEMLRSDVMKFLSREEVKEELKINPILNEFLQMIMKNSPKLIADRRQKTGNDRLCYAGVNVSREYYAIMVVLAEVADGKPDSTHYPTVSASLDALVAKHTEAKHDKPLVVLKGLRDDLEMMYQDESGFDDVLAGITKDAMAAYAAMLDKEKQEAQADKSADGPRQQKMIKIDQGKLDRTIDLSSEIVIVSEFMNYLQSQFSEGNVDANINSLKDATVALQEHSEALSRHLYDIRKVPISEAFQSLPRVVRDTCVTVGKMAGLVISGEWTMVDKSAVPKLETMLVHIIRNSIDHGLETPENRHSAGKPEEGVVTLSAAQQGEMLAITVSDDGRGIDVEKLKLALVEKGLATAQAVAGMTDQQAVDHVFLPGFSISKKVTETSGRGVGMDVVLSSAQEMGGHVRLENRPGVGLKTVITIPLAHTTLIKKGLAVAVGHSVFLIPNEEVMESFRPSSEEIFTVRGKKEVVKRREEIIPLVRLYDLFGINGNVKDPKEGILVLVQNKKNRACFLVDNVIGQRQIIYKDLSVKTTTEPSPFEGISIYDGNKLAMILDMDGIIMQSQMEEW